MPLAASCRRSRQKAGIVQRSWGWAHLVVRGSGGYLSNLNVYEGLTECYTHCARRPSCVIVIMILSENLVDVTSVGIPFTMPAFCFVTAG